MPSTYIVIDAHTNMKTARFRTKFRSPSACSVGFVYGRVFIVNTGTESNLCKCVMEVCLTLSQGLAMLAPSLISLPTLCSKFSPSDRLPERDHRLPRDRQHLPAGRVHGHRVRPHHHAGLRQGDLLGWVHEGGDRQEGVAITKMRPPKNSTFETLMNKSCSYVELSLRKLNSPMAHW